MRPVQLLFILVATLILALPASAQQSCVLSGYIYRNDLSPAAEHILRVNATVPLDTITSLFSASASSDTSDATGYIELTVRRNSVIYISCDPRRPVKGIPTTPPGIALTVPDAPTHQLAALLPATQVPAQHIVAIPAQTSAYGDSIRIADSLARLANERVLSPPHGDSLRTADSLARVALDSASAARQELLNSIAQLQAQLDTAGAATRAVIEADIAALYGQVATLSGQIADLSARVDTVGAAARAALEGDVAALDADNAAQDLLIADAGKWEGTTEITPKAGITSVRPPGAMFKDDSATVYKRLTALDGITFGGTLPWTLYTDGSYNLLISGLAGYVNVGRNLLSRTHNPSSPSTDDLGASTARWRKGWLSNLSVGSPSTEQYMANIQGWVRSDSGFRVGNMYLDGSTLYFPNNTNNYISKYGFSSDNGGPFIWNNKTASSTISGFQMQQNSAPVMTIRGDSSTFYKLSRFLDGIEFSNYNTSLAWPAGKQYLRRGTVGGILWSDGDFDFQTTRTWSFHRGGAPRGRGWLAYFDGNIQQKKDSLADFGITRIAELIIDSTGYVVGDTIAYKVVELHEPRAADNDPARRSGRIVLEFYQPVRTSTPHGSIFEFDIVSDSANGVVMSWCEARVRGSWYSSQSYSAQNTTYFQRWHSAGGAWVGQVASIGTYASSYCARITPALRWLGETPEYFIPCELWSGNQAGNSKVRLEIEFEIPAGFNSDYYVKLINM